jgi:hypothetical protein
MGMRSSRTQCPSSSFNSQDTILGPARSASQISACATLLLLRSTRKGGGAHLAGLALDDNVSTLAESRALHGVGEGSSGGDRLEGLLVLLIGLGLWERQRDNVSS